jgi:hypothetical protein
MANRHSEGIKVRKSAFLIRLDFLGTFCIKAKGAEEKSMASFGRLRIELRSVQATGDLHFF